MPRRRKCGRPRRTGGAPAKKVTTQITGLKKKLKIKKGKKVTLKPVLVPGDSSEPITFKTSNKKIATVSSKGVIKAKKKGKATITVTSGKISVKIKVIVK